MNNSVQCNAVRGCRHVKLITHATA